MVTVLVVTLILALTTVLGETLRQHRPGSWTPMNFGGVVCPGSVPVSLGTTRGKRRILPPARRTEG